jgi:hypothetical protein
VSPRSRPLTARALTCLTLSLITAISACGDDPSEPIAPVALILGPASGSSISEGSTIRLVGAGTDPQQGPLGSDALSWSSSIDGELGTGRTLEVATASRGIHTFTLTATDQDGNQGTASIAVSVEALAFLDGTVDEPQVGVIVNSTANAIRLFQLGDPTQTREIALGASPTVTATGISIRGTRGAVPLGNAASVAVLDLLSLRVEAFFLFPSGNATGSDWVDDETVVVANQETDLVGKFSLSQADGIISETASVTAFPTDVIAVSDSLVLVVSGNLDDTYLPAGEGMVTAIDPRTMTVVDTVRTGGVNPQFADLGADGMLYVVNTGDYVGPSTLAIVDPITVTLVDVIGGFPAGSGDVHAGSDGLVYVSAFFGGTVVWDPRLPGFVRDGSQPVCAPLAGGGCRGAFSAYAASDGSLYQTFFGSPSEGLAPQIFTYEAGTFALVDSIDSGPGPVGIEIRSFR